MAPSAKAPASLTVVTGSDSKVYDGAPLTNSSASLLGLVGGETATLVTTGTITDPGSTVNSYEIRWDGPTVSDARNGGAATTTARTGSTTTKSATPRTGDTLPTWLVCLCVLSLATVAVARKMRR